MAAFAAVGCRGVLGIERGVFVEEAPDAGVCARACDGGPAAATDGGAPIVDAAADGGAPVEVAVDSGHRGQGAGGSDAAVVRECTPGARRCQTGGAIKRQRCDEQGRWQGAPDCVRQACVDGDCRGECEPGTRVCTTQTAFRECGADGTWRSDASCENACVAGRCAGECRPGTRACAEDASTLQSCSDTGSWGAPASCPFGCLTDRCNACRPDASECVNDTEVRTCSSTGAWNVATDCRLGCRAGSCVEPVCSPGTRQCVGTTQLRQCNSTGSGWGAAVNCQADRCRVATCSEGACDQEIAAGASCLGDGTCNASGTCEYCGDGTINLAEECEVFERGWEPETCESDCKRSTYQVCLRDGVAVVGCYCGPGGVCSELCESVEDCPPRPPGSTAICYHQQFCALSCATNAECPRGLACRSDPSQAGPRPGLCLPPEAACSCDVDSGCDECFQIIIVD